MDFAARNLQPETPRGVFCNGLPEPVDSGLSSLAEGGVVQSRGPAIFLFAWCFQKRNLGQRGDRLCLICKLRDKYARA